MEGSQGDAGVRPGREAPAAEEPVAEANRLFADLMEQAAQQPRSRSGPTTVRESAAELEASSQVERGSRLSDVEARLETLRAAISAINDRLASLERTLATQEGRGASNRWSSDARLDSNEDVEMASGGLPVLGLIPEVDRWKDRAAPLASEETQDERVAAEAYRALRTSVLFLGIDHQMRSIQVTSPLQGAGKSTVAANLAATLAQAGTRVIAVSCDLRRPHLHEFFGLSNEKGLTSVINRLASLQSVVQQVPGVPTLKLVASGPVPTNPSELLLSQRAGEIIAVLQNQCDVLLIDCPPALPVTDAVAISQRVQATIVVVDAGSTTCRDLHRTIEALRQVEAPLLGTVVNGISSDHRGFGLGHGPRYEYTSEGPTPARTPSQGDAGAVAAPGLDGGQQAMEPGGRAGPVEQPRKGRRMWGRTFP